MKKNLSNLIVTGALALASLLPSKKAEAQGAVSGSIEYIQSVQKEGNSYPRINGFYTLPGDISGFTFVELYGKDKEGKKKGYFGRTTLDKDLGSGLGLRSIVQHINEPATQVGLGVTKVVPGLPKGLFAKLGIVPLWVGPGSETSILEPKALAQYFVSFPLSTKMGVSAFGDWNLINDNGRVQWAYGEVSVNRNLTKNTSIQYNPALLNQGDAIPKVEHRITAKVKFGGSKKSV